MTVSYLEPMGDAMSDQQQEKPAQEALPTPGEIAEMKDAAAALAAFRNATQGQAVDVGMERSGQLSPSHTPGHTTRQR
jgi:hypothetical protein